MPRPPTNPLSRLGGFLRRHRHAEEVAVEAAGLNLVWTLLRLLGVFGVGAAAAAIAVGTSQTYHPQFSLSSKGAAFIARYEGLRTTPYNDPYNCTVGVGHLIHMGICSQADYTRWRISNAQAMTMLIHDAATAQGYVRSSVTHQISQPQFDALVDFTFNVGGGGLQRSSALAELNAGRPGNVPSRLLVWSYASGHYLSGLHARRVAEGTLFTHGYYGSGLGYYQPPKPPANPRIVPSPVPTWAWRWVEWKLGRGIYRGHAGQLSYRPRSAPSPAPAWAWTFLNRFAQTAR